MCHRSLILNVCMNSCISSCKLAPALLQMQPLPMHIIVPNCRLHARTAGTHMKSMLYPVPSLLVFVPCSNFARCNRAVSVPRPWRLCFVMVVAAVHVPRCMMAYCPFRNPNVVCITGEASSYQICYCGLFHCVSFTHSLCLLLIIMSF